MDEEPGQLTPLPVERLLERDDVAAVLTVERVADDAAMSPYELLTGLRSRVERSYLEARP